MNALLHPEIAPGGAPPDEVLAVRGLFKSFPGVVALAGVDFSVRRGEVHALLGANGAGKSTMIKIIAGLYQRDAGEIRLGGEPVSFAGTAAAIDAGISVIYQDFALVPDLSVADNIFLGREKKSSLGFVDARTMHAEARRLLDMVGAAFPTATLVADLGPGQRQLVEIAKALRSRAKVLILDEPTASLSHGESERLFALVRKLAESGVGIVYVSHRLEEIAPLVNRVTILRDGESAGTYEASEIDRARIIALITGHERSSTREHRDVPASAPVAIEVKGLARADEFEDVSFSVRRGEILVMTGLVGAGRTELLETLFGLRRADAGEVLLDGRPVAPATPREAISAGLALIPEDRRGQGIAVGLPVYENIALPILGRFVSGLGLAIGREIAHARELIDRLNIRTPDPRTLAGALSGGNQQKVALAKWLSTDAAILMFDEPTQGVDVGAKDEIYALINRLALQGRAILIVSSDLEEVLAVGDRILAMREGRIVAEFDTKTASASRIVEAITHGQSS